MVTYYEVVGSQSTSTAGFTMEGGRATMVLDVLAADANDAITDLLGDCARGSNGALNRDLPKAHPDFPWLYATRISNILGLKPSSSKTASQDIYDAEALPYFQAYERYRFTVEFEPRPYAVLPDSSVGIGRYTYYQDSDTSTATGVLVGAFEWERFVDIQVDASPQLLTWQNGKMIFQTASGGATLPNNKEYAAHPRLQLPDGKVTIRWFQVPESYVRSANSHLRKWVGRVNQTDWLDWTAGQLLYLGFTHRRYTPPVPALARVDSTSASFSTEKLCDIEMTFAETRRVGSDVPTAASLTSRSWIPAGHNLQPSTVPRGFYYAHFNDTGTVANQTPMFLSFEIVSLFSDPDV